MEGRGRKKTVEEEEVERSERDREAAVKSGRDSEGDLKVDSGRKRKFYSVYENCDAAENRRSPPEELNSKVAESREIIRAPVFEDVDSSSKDCESGGETSTSVNVFFSGEASLYRDLRSDSPENTMVYKKQRQLPKAPVHVTPLMPSPTELEEFFTSAETHEKKRFSEKYNYDVVMDVPLEGRYQWVPLHP